MADVTGPISTLPGHLYQTPEGMKCDNHPDRPAIKRVQGETDSFGCEMLDLCEECYKEIQGYTERCGACDWCNRDVETRRPYRDMDEGLYGRVYLVCKDCRDRDYQRIKEELDEYDKYD